MEGDKYMKRVLLVLILTLGLAILWYGTYLYCKPVEVEETLPPPTNEEVWIPTEEDIAYQDSMYTIIQNTQSDVDTIKEQVQHIIERLDYKDGSYDSIRYIDRNKENQSR